MKCKVCSKDLFIELDFRSLFQLNYAIHEGCKKHLERKMVTEVIPIENNTIEWISFLEKKEKLNEEFLELFLIGKGLQYCIDNKGWSIVNWMTIDEYYSLDDLTQYLYLKLGDQSFIFLSLYPNM